MEEERLDCLPTHLKLLKMDSGFDLYEERECFSCFYDLHLSAVGCECSLDKYSCLKHSNLLCSCAMDKRFVLLRYTIEELNKLVEALEGESPAIEVWVNKSFEMVSTDANEVCIYKPDVERDMYKTKNHEEKESLTGCAGTKDSSNLNVPSRPYNNVTSEIVQSESHHVTSSASYGTIDSHNIDKKLVIDNGDKVNQADSLDLNLDVISDENENENDLRLIADNHHNKGVSIGENVCCSDSRKEPDNMELGGEGNLSHSFCALRTELSSCSRDVHYSGKFDGGKFGADLQMDSDSGKQPNSIVKKEVIDTMNTSISLTGESYLMQLFGTTVKLISLGSVVCGKLWCSKQAIFPRGMPQYDIFWDQIIPLIVFFFFFLEFNFSIFW